MNKALEQGTFNYKAHFLRFDTEPQELLARCHQASIAVTS